MPAGNGAARVYIVGEIMILENNIIDQCVFVASGTPICAGDDGYDYQETTSSIGRFRV